MTTINNEIMKFDCIIVLANEMDEGNLNLESVSELNLQEILILITHQQH